MFEYIENRISVNVYGSLFLLLTTMFLCPTQSAAWGPVGHETIAYIAEDNLTPATKDKLNAILDPHTDLASIANWADQIRMTAKGTAGWHYIDLPIRKDITVKDEEIYCPDNDCVINQLQIHEGILGNVSQPQSKRLVALKFVVHLMGDLHQPLHCADDGDRGGNDKEVRYKTLGHRGRGAKIKLHALWDHMIETKPIEDPRELASDLEQKITEEDKTEWGTGDEKEWAFESYQLAKNLIYKGMEPGPQDYSDNALPSDYYTKMRPIVDSQLEKAGIRLADVLNEVLK